MRIWLNCAVQDQMPRSLISSMEFCFCTNVQYLILLNIYISDKNLEIWNEIFKSSHGSEYRILSYFLSTSFASRDWEELTSLWLVCKDSNRERHIDETGAVHVSMHRKCTVHIPILCLNLIITCCPTADEFCKTYSILIQEWADEFLSYTINELCLY